MQAAMEIKPKKLKKKENTGPRPPSIYVVSFIMGKLWMIIKGLALKRSSAKAKQKKGSWK
jgi:hypothetical protein